MTKLTVLINSEIDSKEQLFQRMADALHFPSYFGMNWDALDECLYDFPFIKGQTASIEIEQWPSLSSKDLTIFSDVLDHIENESITVRRPEG